MDGRTRGFRRLAEASRVAARVERAVVIARKPARSDSRDCLPRCHSKRSNYLVRFQLV